MNSSWDSVFHEILVEIKEINRKLGEFDGVRELQRAALEQGQLAGEQNLLLSEIITQQQENCQAIKEMAEYLKEYQEIIDFALKDNSRNNEKLLRDLRVQFHKASALLDPNLVGMSRTNVYPVSSETQPVYSLAKSLEIKKAENSLIPSNTTDAAYYRVGFISNLSTSAYQCLDEDYSAFVNTAQQLQVVSTSDFDLYPDGTGVRTVLVGGLDTNGDRFFEAVNLSGTSPVTTVNQFTQCDIINSSVAGSNAGAVGTIAVQSVGGGTTFGAIAPAENNWRSGRLFTDKRIAAYAFSWSIGAYNAGVRAMLDANHIAGNPNAVLSRSTAIVNNNTISINFPIPIKIPKQSLILVRAIAKAEVNEVTTAFQLYVRAE